MKKIVASLAALAAVAAFAAPAAAQPYDYGRPGYGYGHERHDGWGNINERQERIERRIERGLRRGDLTPWEADRLHRRSWQIARLESRYRMNGLSGWERADLNQRLDRLEAQLRFERHDDDYRRYGYRD